MSYGALVRNYNNQGQLDTRNPVMPLYEKNSIALPSDSYAAAVSIKTSTNPLVIAHKPTSSPIMCPIIQTSSGQYDKAEVHKIHGQTPVFDYLTFVSVNSFSDSGAYGFRIYDAQGNTVFRDDIPDLMQPIERYTGTHSPSSSVDVTVSDADNNYFILTPFSALYYQRGSMTAQIFLRLLEYINSVTVRVSDYEVYYGTGIVEQSEDWINSFTLIEIKGV